MLRSMFSAVAGLRAHQTMMDVTGNNVANVNTAGFKASRTTFQETMTQMMRGGTAGVPGGPGGVNPMQIGLGSKIGATDMVYTQGAAQVTGRPTDLAIQGDGFFVVDVAGTMKFQRAGAFGLDSFGNLTGAGGEIVQGWAIGAPRDEANLQSMVIDTSAYTDIEIGQTGMITGRDSAGNVTELGQLAMARFTNPEGLTRSGNGVFELSPAVGAMVLEAPGSDGLGIVMSHTLEMSNVDLAQEFTNLILAQRGFQANARTITASDEMLQELVNLKR